MKLDEVVDPPKPIVRTIPTKTKKRKKHPVKPTEVRHEPIDKQ